MCREHHEQRGRRGFGRHGFPRRDDLVQRLEGYRAHLEEELANVRDLLGRLGPSEPQQPSEI